MNFKNKIKNLKLILKSQTYYFKYYKIPKDKKIDRHSIYFIIDPNISHPGLTDRLNAVICIKYIADINDYDFKLIFKHPFPLNKYLKENEIKWRANRSDISFSVQNSRILCYTGTNKIPVLNKKIKQYHIYRYRGHNILKYNNIPNHSIIWKDIFNKLFKPSNEVLNIVKKQELKEKEYVSVHLRFVNAIECFEEGYNNKLNEKEAKKLIKDCLDTLDNIKSKNTEKIVVFSDCKKFIDIAKNEGYHVLDGKIGHISFNGDEHDVVLKTFVDFFMIARSIKVYRVNSTNMYQSVFSHYAAVSGGAESIKICI